jgi:hypothetical protein
VSGIVRQSTSHPSAKSAYEWGTLSSEVEQVNESYGWTTRQGAVPVRVVGAASDLRLGLGVRANVSRCPRVGAPGSLHPTRPRKGVRMGHPKFEFEQVHESYGWTTRHVDDAYGWATRRNNCSTSRREAYTSFQRPFEEVRFRDLSACPTLQGFCRFPTAFSCRLG